MGIKCGVFLYTVEPGMYKWLVSRAGSEEKLKIYQKQHAKTQRPRWRVFLSFLSLQISMIVAL
jgi:hypothetical protein